MPEMDAALTMTRAGLEPLLASLVGIASNNPWLIPGAAGEGAVAAFIVERLRPLGVDVVVEEVSPGRPNVIARL